MHQLASVDGPRTILLVEDDPDIRDSIADVLVESGFRVEKKENGQQAIRALRDAIGASSPPRLIVLDLMLPIMDGWQFRQEQLRDPVLAHIPVLVISADDSAKAGAINADGFLRKPFQYAELERAVIDVLRVADDRSKLARIAQNDRIASIGLLAAGVSHEINNPLTYVISNLDFLATELKELGDTVARGRLDDLLQAVEDARHGSARVQSIVKHLGTFSRAGEAKSAEVDLARVLELALGLAGNELRHRGKVSSRLGSSPRILGDEARLAQAFVHLLLNAAQALDEARVERNVLEVESGTTPEGWAFAEIRDNGAGIPPEVLPRIFDPFFTTKPFGSGQGLGLYTSYWLITAAGGRIDVESELGRGTSFHVRLPPSRGLERAPDAGAPGPSRADAAPRRGRVLVIDDEPLVLSTVKRSLAPPHDVTTTTSGADALALLEAGERYDVILCDLMMPGMSGMELFDRLGLVAPAERRRIVFFTGGAFTPRAREFLAQVENLRFDKPFRIEALRALVAGLIT